MIIEEGKTYISERGHSYRMKKNKLPYYCFSADMVDGKEHDAHGEHWTKEGEAYHNDCGYNLVKEA